MNRETPKPVLAVLGPTASGKTALALQLASRFGGEIVNCDSRQVYREMCIGTARPSAEEMQKAPHHLFDLISPQQSFSAADYANAAIDCIRQIWNRKNIPVLTGGTGFYYSALAEGLGKAGHDEEKAGHLKALLDEHGLAYMVTMLTELDPTASSIIDTSNSRRVLRAIEIVQTTQKPFAANIPESPLPEAVFYPVVVTRPRDALHDSIARRVDAMISNGLEKEVRHLAEKYGRKASGLNSIGYHEWFAYFDGLATIKEVREQIIIHTRQYAKRQETWFRRRPGTKMYNLSDQQQNTEILLQISDFLRTFAL